VAGAVVLVFNIQKRDILKKSSEIQFEYSDVVLSVQGFYLNEINYMEIIAVKGSSRRLTEISEKLIGIKGIEHGKLIMSRT
jgi:CopG family nickel-responsive transcriptional regulator